METDIDLTKFDDVFLGILQHLGKIEPFLEAIFCFLARRTDFFQLMHNRDDKLGFPPGVAEKIVQRIFVKYQKRVVGKDSTAPNQETRATKSTKKKDDSKAQKPDAKITEIPEPIETVEVQTSVAETSKREEGQKVNEPSRVVASSTKSNEDITEVDQAQATGSVKNNSAKDDPTLEESSKPKPSLESDSYNGAVTDKYSWAQMHGDVDVKVPVPKFVKKSKDIEVKITADMLKIALRQDPPPDSQLTSRVIVDGKLTQRIRHEESIWSLVPGECLQIHLEKANELYWTALLEGEQEIDKTKLDTTKDISEFDEQTQADFQKVMYDHHQKLQGKPTSEEQKTHDLLKQAWDAEGSPFKGTPFDPSRVNISGSGGGML